MFHLLTPTESEYQLQVVFNVGNDGNSIESMILNLHVKFQLNFVLTMHANRNQEWNSE